MADYTVDIANYEVSVYDSTNGATLDEIKDLLKLILEELVAARRP